MTDEPVTHTGGVTLPGVRVPRVLRAIGRLIFAVVNFLVPVTLAAACGAWAALRYVQASGVIRPIFDDSYITLTFARNLAEHGKLSFDGVTWSTGATSPLHVGILALAIKAGAEPLMTGIVIGVVSQAALCVFVYLLAVAIFRSRLAGLLAALAIAFCSYAALDAGNGLETSLFMAEVAASMAAYFGVRNGWGKLLTGFLIGLAILTRPEGAFLLPAFVIYRWMDRAPKERFVIYLRDVVLLSFFGLGALAFSLGLSIAVNGSIGGTATAKLKFFQDNTRPMPEKISLASDNIVLFASPLVTLIGLAAVAFRRRESALFALFWLPVLAFYTLLFPGGLLHYFYRYQHPVLPLLAVLAGGGGAYLLELALRSGFVTKLVVVATLVVAIAPIYYQFNRWQGIYAQASIETLNNLEPMARDLDTIIKPNETLATHDIGVVSYFGHYQILDLVGLVNPDVVPYHKDRQVKKYLDIARPNYLLVFPEWDADFLHIYPGDDPQRYELVKVYPGGVIRVSPYLLYRIHYPDTEPAPAEGAPAPP